MTAIAAPEAAPAQFEATRRRRSRGLLAGGWTRGGGLLVAVAVLAAVALASIAYGSKPMALSTAWDGLWSYDPTIDDHLIIRSLRIPRTGMGLLVGVALGLAVAAAALLYRLTHVHVTVEHDIDSTRSTVRLRGSATFLRLPEIAEALDTIPPGREVHLDLDGVAHIDHAVLELLAGYRHPRCHGPVIASVIPGRWMLTKSQLPLGP